MTSNFSHFLPFSPSHFITLSFPARISHLASRIWPPWPASASFGQQTPANPLPAPRRAPPEFQSFSVEFNRFQSPRVTLGRGIAPRPRSGWLPPERGLLFTGREGQTIQTFQLLRMS